MSFVSNLAANPAGGIAGQPAPQDTLGIINNLKDREMRDFQNKAQFMSDLSIKQDRLRKIYGLDGGPAQQKDFGSPIPGGVNSQQATQQQPIQQSQRQGQDPNAMTGYEKGELDIKQKGLGLEQAKLTQQGQLGDQALGIKQQAADLAQGKSDQINKVKTDEVEVAKGKLALATKALEDKTLSTEKLVEAHKVAAKAAEDYHNKVQQQQRDEFDAKQAQQQQEFSATLNMHKQGIKNAQNTKTTVTNSPDGSSRTTTKQTGDASKTVKLMGKDKKYYDIPADKVDEWNQNHAPDSAPQEDDSSTTSGQ
jgi:hypothetical protein